MANGRFSLPRLLSCGVLFALLAGAFLMWFVVNLSGNQRGVPANPNGMGAHLGRIAALNAEIAGEGQR